MIKKNGRRFRERRIQKLIRDHPYLLDKELMNLRGRIERPIRSGRLDIDFETERGWVIVECKIGPLVGKDLQQLCRYLKDFRDAGKCLYKAYLIGGKPRTELDADLVSHYPGIRVVHLLYALPDLLALCQEKHYFDANLETCPYDGAQRIPGKDLELLI